MESDDGCSLNEVETRNLSPKPSSLARENKQDREAGIHSGGGSEPYTLHSYRSTSTPLIAYDTSKKKPAGRSTREQIEPEIGTNQSEIQAQFRRMTGRAYPRSNLTEQNIQMGERFC